MAPCYHHTHYPLRRGPGGVRAHGAIVLQTTGA